MSTRPSPSPDPLLTPRAALVLLIAIVVGLVAGGLGYLAHDDVPTATLIAGGAVAGTVALAHNLLGR